MALIQFGPCKFGVKFYPGLVEGLLLDCWLFLWLYSVLLFGSYLACILELGFDNHEWGFF